jgi:hypothetical protein
MQRSLLVSFLSGFFLSLLVGFLLWKKLPPPSGQTIREPASLHAGCDEESNAQRGPASLLPPPEYRKTSPEEFETNEQGEVRVDWLAVPGARRYRVNVLKADGTPIHFIHSRKPVLYLKDLPPEIVPGGEYTIALQSMNRDDTPGVLGEKRKLVVNGQAPVVAPSIKVIRVED